MRQCNFCGGLCPKSGCLRENVPDTVVVQRDLLERAAGEMRRARLLCSLVTIRQIVDGGDYYIQAAKINPWCMNEGTATGNERLRDIPESSLEEELRTAARAGKQ